jgi:hypothetical protein
MTETALLKAGKEGYFRVSQAFERLGWGRGPPNDRGETAGWGILLRFLNRDGKDREVFVTAAQLHGELGALCAVLADAGMDLEADDAPRRGFRKYLLRTDLDDRVTTIHLAGWSYRSDSIYMVMGEITSEEDDNG